LAYLSKHNLLLIALVLAIAIESISIVELALAPSMALSAPDPFVGLAMSAFNLLIPLSPFLLLCLLYFPIVRIGISWGSRHSKRLKRLIDEFLSGMAPSKGISANLSGRSIALLKHSRVSLIASMIAASLIAYLPYRSDLNPQQNLVGVDTPLYAGSLNQMLSKPALDAVIYAFTTAFHGSRPMLFLVAYSLARIGNVDGGFAFKLFPMILAPTLVLASYFFVLLGNGKRENATLAAILSACSPIVTVGIWAGYYANWLAIIAALAYLAVLLLHLRAASVPKFLLAVGLSVVIILIHPWTWIVLLAITFAFLFSLRKEVRPGVLLRLGISVLVAGLISQLLWTVLLGGYGVVASGENAAGHSSATFSTFAAFLPNLVYGLLFTYDGILANSVLFALAFVTVIGLSFRDRFERLLILWVVLISLAFPLYGDLLQTRLVYDLPITIMAASGLLLIFSKARLNDVDTALTLILVILFNLNYAILAVARSPIL
jgi:hypothetical protein